MKKFAGIILIAVGILFLQSHSNKKFTLFILGDSISLQYSGPLSKLLGDKATIQHKGSQENAMKNLDVPVDANGGDSRMVLQYLKGRVNDKSFQPDLLLLNCGLHDIKRNPSTNIIAVDTAEYRQNLEAIYHLLCNKKIPIVWIRTTEVIDSIHAEKSKAFNRYAKDVDTYNAIADQVFKSHNVPVIDLYNFTRSLSTDRFADHVHYIPKVQQQQAAFIGNFLIGWMAAGKK